MERQLKELLSQYTDEIRQHREELLCVRGAHAQELKHLKGTNAEISSGLVSRDGRDDTDDIYGAADRPYPSIPVNIRTDDIYGSWAAEREVLLNEINEIRINREGLYAELVHLATEIEEIGNNLSHLQLERDAIIHERDRERETKTEMEREREREREIHMKIKLERDSTQKIVLEQYEVTSLTSMPSMLPP